MANLPADLPEDWTSNQKISPNGTEVGLSEQHGYNYLMKQVNDAQNEINNIGTTIEEALTDVAKEASVQEIITSIGETDDTGGSTTLGSVMAKLNEDLKLDGSALQEIINLGVIINGEASPYGTGLLGDVTFNSSKFTWPTQDFYNRYVVQVKSLTIPSGQTMKPPAKCDGLYILSQGDVVIDGNIDVRGLRKTFGPVTMSPTINVGTRTFELAKGGYAPKGGVNGRGGKNAISAEVPVGTTPTPQMTLQDSISGNINGGGIGSYALGGESVIGAYSDDNNRLQWTYDYNYNDDKPNKTQYIKYNNGPRVTFDYTAPTALIIIAKGKVTINGKILATGQAGKEPTANDEALYYDTTGSSRIMVYGFTLSGNGAIPPSGGGAVTIICKQIVINGKIDTNGNKLTTADKPDNRSKKPTIFKQWSTPSQSVEQIVQDPKSYVLRLAESLYCGEGGKGGTFISTAGEIKVYEGVDE